MSSKAHEYSFGCVDAARERLYHIASMVKSEIIDTLNLAAKK